MTPKVRSIIGLCNVLQGTLKTTAISVALVLTIQCSGIDIFADFRSPVYGKHRRQIVRANCWMWWFRMENRLADLDSALCSSDLFLLEFKAVQEMECA